MTEGSTWAILVATRHGAGPPTAVSDETRLAETRQLISRAKSITGPATTCALVAPQFASEWKRIATDLPPHNIFTQPADAKPLDGVTRVLRAIRARDLNASVVLIPADHCAAVESAWVRSARGAVTLARDHLNTVYLLHDQTSKDDRPFEAARDFCSSTVIVGSAVSLLELCEGSKATKVLDLMTDDLSEPVGEEPINKTDARNAPINLVHVRLVEEYARIQSGRYGVPTSAGIDLTA
jgi:hypothetical protein